MNGLELLAWLQAIPTEELRHSEVLLDSAFIDLTSAKYYKAHDDYPNTIYLVNK